jgi:hypothetical protein
MDEIIIKSGLDLLENLKLPDAGHIFRGQGNHAWPLIPSIARVPRNCINSYENWNVLLDTIMVSFQKYSLPYLNSWSLDKRIGTA